MAETIYTASITALENGWGSYVQRFRQLSPETQAAVLKNQGYARLADLLAHVIAWWEEGLEAVRRLPDTPDFSSPEHDVNAFNAQAVARFQQSEEDAVVQRFETLRREWLALVKGLPEEAFSNKRIADRLHIELIGHLDEHRF